MYFIHQIRKFQIGESMDRKVFIKSSLPRAVIFLSGSGSNAEKLLESPSCGVAWSCCAVVTDRPGTSNARQIAEKYGLELIEEDIFRFYEKHGLQKISIATEKGFAVRQLWTEALRRKLAHLRPDFGILAGFIPLTNLVADFPCLNIHPGDLTVEKDGCRLLVGLHNVPVRTALLAGHRFLRSSVIIATPFTPGAKEMDNGHVLGISRRVPVLLPPGATPDSLAASESLLAETAERNLENLKVNGDWTLFPEVVADFAAGRFAESNTGRLLYRGDDSKWQIVKTVEYNDTGKNPIPV